MKIGIVAFNRSWRFMGGGITCADCYKQVLTSRGFDADIIAINFTACPFDYPGYDKKYDFNNREWDEVLQDYDRLVILHYASLGRGPQSRYYTNRLINIIDKRDPNTYALVLHDEFECTGVLVTDLIHHGVKDRWLFNGEEVCKYLGDGLKIKGTWFNHITPKKIEFNLESKTREMHYVGRLQDDQKFIIALLTICSSLSIDLEMYGPVYKPLFQTITTLPYELQSLWERSYKGRCEEPMPAIAVRSPFKFSWGVVRGYVERIQRLTTFSGDFMPRLEQSIIESVRTGSLPILVGSTIPEWYPHEYAITLDSYDITQMIDQIKDQLVYDSRTVERLHECNKLLDRRIELSLENLREILNF